MAESTSKKDAALALVAMGLRVFPFPADGSFGSAASGWQERASGDAAQAADWWDERPDANPGVVCGPESGVLVLDVDPRNGGEDSLRRLQAEHGPLPETFTVRTGSGGTHFYFAYQPLGQANFPDAGGYSGLDLKVGDGGGSFVYGPGTTRLKHDGKPYEVLRSASFAPLPETLADVLTASKNGRKERISTDIAEPVLEGKRDDTAFRMACKWIETHSPGETLALLRFHNEARFRPQLDDETLKEKVRSAQKYVRQPPELIYGITAAEYALEPEDPPEELSWLGWRGEVTEFYGLPGFGKSTFLALDATKAAEGGHRVLVVSFEEGNNLLLKRLTEVRCGALANVVFGTIKEINPDGDGRSRRVRALEEVDELCQVHKPDYIIFDSLSSTINRCRIPKPEQSDGEGWHGLIDMFKERFAESRRCAVVFVHHAARAGNSRGSTGIEGAADNIIAWELSNPKRGKEQPGRILNRVSCRWGHPSIEFQWDGLRYREAGPAFEASADRLEESPRDRIRRALSAEPWLHYTGLLKAAGGNHATLREALGEMLTEGLVETRKSGRRREYRLNDEGGRNVTGDDHEPF